jgi:hypothetical protein
MGPYGTRSALPYHIGANGIVRIQDHIRIGGILQDEKGIERIMQCHMSTDGIRWVHIGMRTNGTMRVQRTIHRYGTSETNRRDEALEI